MPQSGIYAITNTLTGAMYVGSAIDIKKRKREHLHALRHDKHHSPYLQRSFNQHGESAFVWSVLEEVSPVKDLLFERETYWVQTLQPAYNASTVSATRLGAKFTPEQIERSRLAQLDPEVRKRKSEALLGHEISVETRAKISESLTDREVSEAVKQNLLYYSLQRTTEERRLEQLGKKRSEETRKRQSEAALAREKPTEETRKILSEAAKKRVYTDEGRKKRSEMMKARWQQRKNNPQQHTLFE